MSDLKRSALWAIVGGIIGAVAFAINWLFGPFVIYRFLLAPGNVVLSLFSEETEFWPKLGILLTGQYLISLIVIFILIKIFKWSKKA